MMGWGDVATANSRSVRSNTVLRRGQDNGILLVFALVPKIKHSFYSATNYILTDLIMR